jgi:Trypsin-like peptidase domain
VTVPASARQALAWLALLACTSPLAQDPTPALVKATTKEVGQVIADGCAGSTRTGTAFVWPDSERVVTARHVVAGCAKVSVRFPGKAPVGARPERELTSEDLVLLRLETTSGLTPLRIDANLPPIHSRVAAVGYALGAPTAADKLLTVDATNVEPGAKLKDLLPAHIRQEIQANGPWSLETRILRLDGNLVSGLSGAPLLGPGGAVVAIGAGGLQDGAGGIVWAVRAAYLPGLQNAPTIAAATQIGRSTKFAFADQVPQSTLTQVSCGKFMLTRSRTLPLSQLQRYTDDPRGLGQLMHTVGSALSPSGTDRYDVWVDLTSGTALAVPEGTQLVNGPVGCFAAVSPTVGLTITTHRVQATDLAARQAEVQQMSVAFENSLMAVLPGLQTDPMFTYVLPITRQDGFVVNRKAGSRNFLTGSNQLQVDYAFLTHLTRGSTYVGISAVRMNQHVRMDEAQFCGANPLSPQCASYHASFAIWARAAVGVFLSTIPPI